MPNVQRNILTKKGKAVRWEGLPEIQKNVNSLLSKMGHREGQKVAGEVKRVLMGAALVVRDEAKDLVPVDTGLLKSAIFAAYGDERKADVLVGVNHRIAPHSHLVEFGARGGEMPAQPFMRPAITVTRPKVANIVAGGLKQIIADTLPK
jgi:HK97 gp10 family phage protein